MPNASSPRSIAVLFVIAAAIAVLAWWIRDSDPMPDGGAAHSDGRAAAAQQANATLDTQPPAAAVDAAATQRESVAAPAATPAADAPTSVRRGRVVDSRGQVLADVPVGWAVFEPTTQGVRATSNTTRSDAQGRFELDAPTQASVPAAGTGWCTLRTTPCEPASDAARELLLVAAPAIELRGRTTRADDGTPLADVMVQANLLFLTEFPTPLDHTFVPMPEPARSGADGEYRLADAPLAAGVELGFHRQGFTAPRIASLDARGGRLDVALVPKDAQARRIHGRVRDAKGPVAGVEVQLGFDQQTTSDARGEFSFEAPPKPSRLVALRRGWQPLVRERVGADTPELDLLLVGEALSITGTLRFADGKPAPGWRFDLADPTRGYGYWPIERACLPTPPAAECFAITDAAGRFEVSGLADRAYTLLAYEPTQLITVTSAPIAAGTRDAVLTIPADACLAQLRGTVVDRRGVAVAGAAVSTWLSAASVEGAVGGPHTTTAADGTFVLANAPRRGVKLGVAKEGWRYAVQPIEAWTANGTELRIVLTRMCAVRVEGEAELIVQFLDADGSLLHAECHSQTMVSSTNALTLHGGKSPVLSLPETTATVLWRRGEREVGRKPVFLDPAPGAVTLVVAGQ